MKSTSFLAIGIVVMAFMVALLNHTSGSLTDWYTDSTSIAQRGGLNAITGDGISLSGVDDPTNDRVAITYALDLVDSGSDGDASTTESDSGMEIVSGELALLRGCDDDQVLKWDETADDWNCEADAAGSITILTSGSDGDSNTTDSDAGLELVGGELTLLRGCDDNYILKWDETADDWNCEADATGAGGSAIVLDLGDDASNESVDITEIATTGDTNSIFGEPSADKLLITVSNNWPSADTADALSGDPTDCGANNYAYQIDAAGDLTCSTIDLSDSVNLVAGTNITLSGDTLNVDDAFVLNDGDTMTGALVLDDTSLQIQEGVDTLTITVPTLTAGRAVTFPDAAGEVSLLGQAIDISAETNLTAGDHITLTDDDLDVDDDFVFNDGDTMTGALVLDDTSLQIQEGVDTLTITVPTLTASRSVTFPDAAGEVTLLGQSIDLSDSVNLTAGDHITLTDDDLDVDDDFLFNDGDVGTGVYDFGGADSFEIPNASGGPTVDAAGEIGVDTSSTRPSINFHDGAAERSLPSTKPWSIALESPSDDDNILFIRVPYAVTITALHCIVDPADSGESVVIIVQERDATGDNPTGVDGATAITCDNDGAVDDGSLSNAAIDSGDWMSLDIGTVSGTVSWLIVSVYWEATP